MKFINTQGDNISLEGITNMDKYKIKEFEFKEGYLLIVLDLENRNIEKDGKLYRFRSWKTEDGGIEIYYPRNICRPVANMTFIGQWDKVTGDNYYQLRFIDSNERIERDNVDGRETSNLSIPLKANIRRNGAW